MKKTMNGTSILSVFSVREEGIVNRLMYHTTIISSKKGRAITVESWSICIKLQEMFFVFKIGASWKLAEQKCLEIRAMELAGV